MQDRILDAAAKVFSQKGYHKACMDDIASEASVAKGSLYYHFHNKSQLYRDVAVRGIESLRLELQEAADMRRPIEETVAAVIDRISALCFDNTGLFNIIMSEMPEGIETEDWQQMQEAKGQLLEYLSVLLKEGHEYEHIIRPMDFSLVTHALMSFIYSYRKQSQGPYDRDRMLREIREIIMHGIMLAQ